VNPSAPLLRIEVELDLAILEGEHGVVTAHPDILSRVELGPTLPHQDVPCYNLFPRELLDSKSLTWRVLSISG